MKSIQTKYNGYRFRSRTEARWAIYFEEILEIYEYEKEGFILGSGKTYLPDFYLPMLMLWVEIKGIQPCEGEIALCRELSRESRKHVMMIHGQPDPEDAQFYYFTPEGLDFGPHKINWLYSITRYPEEPSALCEWIADVLTNFIGPGDVNGDGNSHAYNAAKSARFEYGECGAVA